MNFEFFARKFLLSSTVKRELSFLNKSQWFSRKEIEKIQMKRLKALMEHCYRNVPYYHFVMKRLNLTPYDFNKLKDLEKLPVITKDEIKNNITLIKNDKIQRKLIYKKSTSGSTGRPLTYFIDKNSLERKLAIKLRFDNWVNYKIGEKIAFLWSPNFDLWNFYTNLTLLQKIRNGMGKMVNNELFIPASNLSNKKILYHIVKLKNFKPKILSGYTNSVYLLAKKMRNSDIKFSSIILNAETVNDYQKEEIKKIFNSDVFNRYAIREVGPIAQDCPAHEGLHISSESLTLEIQNGRSKKNGGEIVITDLLNHSFPFIRYRTEDLGKLMEENCSCGRSLPLLDSVIGRTTDFIISREGRVISGMEFVTLMKKHEWLKQFQIMQESLDLIKIKIVKFSEDENIEMDLDGIRKKIRQLIGKETKIKIIFTKKIKQTKSGKYKFIISRKNYNSL